jgi:hypothetical protein
MKKPRRDARWGLGRWKEDQSGKSGIGNCVRRRIVLSRYRYDTRRVVGHGECQQDGVLGVGSRLEAGAVRSFENIMEAHLEHFVSRVEIKDSDFHVNHAT